MIRKFMLSVRTTIAAAAIVTVGALSGCSKAEEAKPGVPLSAVPGHESLAQDHSIKQGPRMVPAEAYVRTYLQLFGGLSPLAAQTALRGADGVALFDSWNEYLSSLGLPDYTVDAPRLAQTNTLMVTTFERLGIALCDRTLEKDLRGSLPLAKRSIFAFEKPAAPVTEASFAPAFDIMHRTFLGYPAALADSARRKDFLELYQVTVAEHGKTKATPASRFTAEEAGWAAVCYGLVRHPEFHLY
jgi:hypothetical protein